MKTYTKPTVQNHPEGTGTVIVSLSAMQERGLTVVIAGKQKTPLYDVVYLVLGADVENPEWMGEPGSLVSDDPENPQIKTEDTLLNLPKEALRAYAGKEVQLRYQTYGESEERKSSSPVTLKIQP